MRSCVLMFYGLRPNKAMAPDGPLRGPQVIASALYATTVGLLAPGKP